MYAIYQDARITAPVAGYGKKACQGRKKHTGGAYERRHHRTSHLRRVRKETFYDDDGRFLYQWVSRGKLVEDAECVGDIDWFEWRARHSTGWKDHKYRHQWEHNVCLKEKHHKNRAGKRLRRGLQERLQTGPRSGRGSRQKSIKNT